MTQGTPPQAAMMHPIDQLIEQLVTTRRSPAETERAQIIQHIAIAPFRPDRVRVDPFLRGKTLQGHTFSASKEISLLTHWGKRILVDKEWDQSTTPQQYEQDIRDSVVHAEAIHFGHTLTQGIQVGTLVANFLPTSRTGFGRKPYIYVVYSVPHSCILTGHQSTGQLINHGGDLLWL